MRSEATIKKLVLDLAVNDDRIRAVMLNGSRANPAVRADKYQDFDIVFIVTGLESFTINHNWTDIFGEKIIWQLPDEMAVVNNESNVSFSYLMQFTDGNRIDLTLFPVDRLKTNFVSDSLTILWLDKDQLFKEVIHSSDKDYHIQPPTEKEFLEACNEFWWVSIYVAKGILRTEITYAKEMLETVVRPMFMKMIQWKIGLENNFSVSFGKSGRFMNRYLAEDYYHKVLQTYAGFDKEDNWKSLFIMTMLFEQASTEISGQLNFAQNKEEQQNTIAYLRYLYAAQQD